MPTEFVSQGGATVAAEDPTPEVLVSQGGATVAAEDPTPEVLVSQAGVTVVIQKGMVYAHGTSFGNDGERLVVPARGDRAAWDDLSYPGRHARDLDEDKPRHHLPAGATEGQMPQWSGGKIIWVDAGAGDMQKATYDTDDDGIVDAAEELDDGVNQVTASDARTHLDDPDKHREIDDAATGTTDLWSASKISSELAGKSDTGHTHIENDITDLEHDAVKLQGRDVAATAPTDGQALRWNETAGQWEPQSGSTTTDSDAIHKSVASEIHSLTEKTSPANDDELIIEDSAASYGKKRVKIGNLPGGSGGGDETHTAAYASRPSPSNDGDLFLPSDGFVIERDTGSVWVPWGPIFPLHTPPTSGWTWVNQGTASVSYSRGAIILTNPDTADQFRGLVRSVPSTPYTITAMLIECAVQSNRHRYGIWLRESSSGKVYIFYNGVDRNDIRIERWNSPSSFNSAPLANAVQRPFRWMRVSDDGTNRIWSWSQDGQNFVDVLTESNTNWITADQAGFCSDCGNSSYKIIVTLLSWEES